MMFPNNKNWIVVLGAPTEEDGSASFVQKQRCQKAFDVFETEKKSTVITMGAAVANSFIEAITMRSLLLNNGMMESDVMVEKNTASTREQILLIKKWMNQYSPNKVTIVSDSMHILRIKMLCKLARLDKDKLSFAGSGYPESKYSIAKRFFYEAIAGFNEIRYFSHKSSQV